MVIKLVSAETNLGSVSNVNTATLVRLFNNHSAAILITRKTAAGATIGSCTVNNKETVLLSKDPTDTLTAASNGASVLVAQIAYQN